MDIKRSFFIIAIFFKLSICLSTFQPNDLAILYPIADMDFNSYYPGLNKLGKQGPLLTGEQFTFISSHLMTQDENPGQFATYNTWKILSIRIDPCSARQNSNCQPEIRLVAQPYEVKEFKNSALHLVYEIDENQLVLLLQKIRQLNSKYDIRHSNIISPHSGLHTAKITDFQKDFETLFFPLIGQENLFRIGIMVSKSSRWLFAGYETSWDPTLQKKVLKPESIPHGDNSEFQVFSGRGFSFRPTANSKVEVYPKSDISSAVGHLMKNRQLRKSFEILTKENETLNKAEKKHIEQNQINHKVAVEIVTNTQHFNRFNTDCFSCHGASQALKYSQKVFSKNFSGLYPYPKTNWQTKYSAEAIPQAMIAFGYVSYGFPRPSLSDRVRVEVAESLKRIKSLIPD